MSQQKIEREHRLLSRRKFIGAFIAAGGSLLAAKGLDDLVADDQVPGAGPGPSSFYQLSDVRKIQQVNDTDVWAFDASSNVWRNRSITSDLGLRTTGIQQVLTFDGNSGDIGTSSVYNSVKKTITSPTKLLFPPDTIIVQIGTLSGATWGASDFWQISPTQHYSDGTVSNILQDGTNFPICNGSSATTAPQVGTPPPNAFFVQLPRSWYDAILWSKPNVDLTSIDWQVTTSNASAVNLQIGILWIGRGV